MSIWVNGKEKNNVLCAHTYSWVSVWHGWDLARGSAPGSACMFTCKGWGQSMDGKGWSCISASGFTVSQEWGGRCMFHRTWPLHRTGACAGSYLTNCCIIIGCAPIAFLCFRAWIDAHGCSFRWRAHNPTCLCTDSSVTQGNKERRHHYNLSAYYSLACFNRFRIRRLILTESSSFSKQHIRFFALFSSTLEFRQITQNQISHLLLLDLCFISTCMFFRNWSQRFLPPPRNSGGELWCSKPWRITLKHIQQLFSFPKNQCPC